MTTAKTGGTRKQTRDRRGRVLEFREQALRLIAESGKWKDIGPTRVKVFEGGGFSIIHRTPEHRFPASEQLLAQGISADEQRRLHGEYGIEMWAEGGGKVLNLSWNSREPPTVVAFERGPWEYGFLALRAGATARPRTIGTGKSKRRAPTKSR